VPEGLTVLKDACIAARAEVEHQKERSERQKKSTAHRSWTDDDGMVAWGSHKPPAASLASWRTGPGRPTALVGVGGGRGDVGAGRLARGRLDVGAVASRLAHPVATDEEAGFGQLTASAREGLISRRLSGRRRNRQYHHHLSGEDPHRWPSR
jgi:hypothetical protein